jgi:hypothetical protein
MKKLIGGLVLVGLICIALLFIGMGRQSGAYNNKPKKAVTPSEVKRMAQKKLVLVDGKVHIEGMHASVKFAE